MLMTIVMALTILLLPAISRARDYSAASGRFMTMDTFEGDQENPQSLHKYAYAADNPVNRIDPSGHDDIGDVLAVMNVNSLLFAQISPVTSTAATATGASGTSRLLTQGEIN